MVHCDSTCHLIKIVGDVYLVQYSSLIFISSSVNIWFYRILGTPTEETWPGVTKLPDYKPIFPKWSKEENGGLKKAVPTLCDEGINLLEVSISS